MISRRRAREFSLQILYAAEVGGDSLEKASRILAKEDPPVPLEAQQYGFQLANSVLEHKEKVDKLISESSENWDVERFAVIDRIILRMAIVELMTVADVPAKVCINEAVEIAKKFSTENSSRFVNGILDSVAHQLMNPGFISTFLTGSKPKDPNESR